MRPAASLSSLEAIQNYVRGKNFPVETIVVDDGSTDNTVEVASRHAGIRVLRNERNRGKGFSVRRGVLEARGELVLFTDADLSAPIEEADKLLAAMESIPRRCGGGFTGARTRADRHSPIAVSRMGRPILQLAGPDFLPASESTTPSAASNFSGATPPAAPSNSSAWNDSDSTRKSSS